MLVERVEPDVEVDRVDQPARRGQRRPSSADSAAVIASGFSQTTCRPAARIRSACGTWRWFGEVTWTTSTTRSSSSSSSEAIGARDAEGLGPDPAALRRAAEDAANLDPDPAQRLDVDGADEARADDGRADVGDPPHALFTHLFVSGANV